VNANTLIPANYCSGFPYRQQPDCRFNLSLPTCPALSNQAAGLRQTEPDPHLFLSTVPALPGIRGTIIDTESPLTFIMRYFSCTVLHVLRLFLENTWMGVTDPRNCPAPRQTVSSAVADPF
jgi:hypothetical protein